MIHLIDFKGYHLVDYLFMLHREKAKRESTYPKLIAKAEKQGKTEDEVCFLSDQLTYQKHSLNCVYLIIIGDVCPYSPDSAFSQMYYQMWLKDAIEELVREMNCRIKYYPRMVFRKRITAEKAADETAIWKGLIEFFVGEYAPEVKIQFLKTKCKIVQNE